MWPFTLDVVLLYESQELRSAADWGALHPKWVALLQRLQQGVQWWGVPLWQQLPGDEWAASRTGQPGRWAALTHSGKVRSGGACDWLEQRSWKLWLSNAHCQGLSPMSSSNMTSLLFSLDTISEEHANIWGAWHTTLKPILKDQQFTGKQYTIYLHLKSRTKSERLSLKDHCNFRKLHSWSESRIPLLLMTKKIQEHTAWMWHVSFIWC